MVKHCPSCGSIKFETFTQDGYIIMACSRCGYICKKPARERFKY